MVTQSGHPLPLQLHCLWWGDGGHRRSQRKSLFGSDHPLTARGFCRDGHGAIGLTMPGVGVGDGVICVRVVGGSGKRPALPPVVSPLVHLAPGRQGTGQGTGRGAALAPSFPPTILGAMRANFAPGSGKLGRSRILTPCERPWKCTISFRDADRACVTCLTYGLLQGGCIRLFPAALRGAHTGLLM